MKGSRAAVRYAKALMQLAQEKGAIDAIIVDVKLIHETINSSKELSNLLASPLVKSEQKQNILTAIFSEKINALTMSFVNQVVNQNREGVLNVIATQFIGLYNEMNKIAQVSLTTASAIDEQTKTSILNTIKEKYQLSQIDLTENVNPDLLGGLVLRIGDQQLDASIKRQLKNIENELVQA